MIPEDQASDIVKRARRLGLAAAWRRAGDPCAYLCFPSVEETFHSAEAAEEYLEEYEEEYGYMLSESVDTLLQAGGEIDTGPSVRISRSAEARIEAPESAEDITAHLREMARELSDHAKGLIGLADEIEEEESPCSSSR